MHENVPTRRKTSLYTYIFFQNS